MAPWAGAVGACHRLEILRPPAAASPVRHLCTERRRHRSLDNGGLGRLHGGLLEHVGAAIGRRVRAGASTHADDTKAPVLDPGRGKTKTGRLWVAERDERPFASTAPPAAYYLFSQDRKAIHAKTLLYPCRGFLHADAYAGFGDLYLPDPKTNAPRLVEVACWSHARRHIYEVYLDTDLPAASEALDKIARLFAIEADMRGKSPDQPSGRPNRPCGRCRTLTCKARSAGNWSNR